MSVANNALLNGLGITGFVNSDDDIFLPNVTWQAAAHPVRGETVRVTAASANSSMRMKSIVTGEAAPITFVINDSAFTIVVFCEVGEKLNGTLNSSLSIPTGQSGI